MVNRIRSIGWRRGVIGLLGLALIGGVAVPAVSAATPAPGADPAPITAAGFAARHPLLAGTVRADLTVVKRDGTTVLVHYEVGRVTAVSDTSITIQGRDGKGASFVVTSKTVVRAKGHRISISDLEVGDRAMVFGTDSNGTYTAFLIRCVSRPAGAAPYASPSASQ